VTIEVGSCGVVALVLSGVSWGEGLGAGGVFVVFLL
jgi:hypothetical protein